ncbi:MAG: glycosyltransferase family 2 protein [Clostridia bacterium]|nr:glycosyltransferase family 2 protein [Clostridia bacterium]
MITVLLATYNGEKYISEQLDSLINQTYTDFRIAISDDGSTDKTPEILNEYQKKYPDKIEILGGEKSGSAKNNFMKLLLHCNGGYVMFCDQDDYWQSGKIEKTYKKMLESEKQFKGMPILIHTDICVADSNLNIISNSFFDFQRISPDFNKLNNVLVQNNVTGCTVMINEALLLELKKNPPKEFAMHDWWLNLVATLKGKVGYITEPTMLYRQHGDNEVGAKKATGIEFIVNKYKSRNKTRQNYLDAFSQAKSLLDIYGETMTEDQKSTVKAFISLESGSKLKKVKTIRKYDFRKNTLLRTIGQYISI